METDREKRMKGRRGLFVSLSALNASHGLLASPKGNLCCALLGSDQCCIAAQSLKEDTSEYSGGEHPWAAGLLKHHKTRGKQQAGKSGEGREPLEPGFVKCRGQTLLPTCLQRPCLSP